MQQVNESKKQTKRWYKKWWGLLLLIVFVGPFVLLVFLGILATIFQPSKEDNQNNTSAVTQESVQTADASSKIPYKEVERWNSGSGRTIVIDKQYDNEASLTQLATELNEENSTRDISWVYIYTDDTASLYRKESFCDPAQSDRIRGFKQYWAALYQKDKDGSRITVFEDRSCNIDAARKTIQL